MRRRRTAAGRILQFLKYLETKTVGTLLSFYNFLLRVYIENYVKLAKVRRTRFKLLEHFPVLHSNIEFLLALSCYVAFILLHERILFEKKN